LMWKVLFFPKTFFSYVILLFWFLLVSPFSVAIFS
jgi:hypothetical protein